MPPLFHLLQVSDVLDTELGSALAESVPVLAWEPVRSLVPSRIAIGHERERLYAPDSTLRLRQLPLLRGFSRAPMSWIADTHSAVLKRLLQQTPNPEQSPLICTVPYFAGVAERWPGPVVYWLTDLIAEYASADRAQVEKLDRRMCRASTLVCPNSIRLSNYLVERGGCKPAKIQIVPNATRESNVLEEAPSAPMPLPEAIATIPRPIAGVVGNLAGNMDWLLLQKLIDLTPYLSWLFVGPTTMQIPDPVARHAREHVMSLPNTYFVPRQPYGALASFARAFDVAVLPYLRCEPTYSGSSTRFYEHLAACRPMIATRGLEELNRKEPLLKLVDTAEEAAQALNILHEQNFNDGLISARWEASQQGTWQTRARTIVAALSERVPELNHWLQDSAPKTQIAS
jgi:hypothetical protein